MSSDHTERAFESAIEDCLLSRGGYVKGDGDNFDRVRCLDSTILIPFIRQTQPQIWQQLEKLHKDNTAAIVLDDLCKTLDSQGALDVIRHGFKCFGKLIKVAYFAPAHKMNPDTQALYDANRLSIARQLHYSTANENSIDTVLSINGLPVAGFKTAPSEGLFNSVS